MADSRSKDFERIAYELGMDYSPKDDWGLFTYLKDFRLFRQGHNKRITNILCKKDDWLKSQVYVFDYRYIVSAGNKHSVHRQTVFFVESKDLGLPAFWMRPENFFHKIANLLGFKDIDFEAFPEFSKHYYLKGENEDYIRHSMTDEVLQFFTIEKNWCLEGVNYYLILYRRGGYLQPEEVIAFYRQGLRVLALFKTDPLL